MLESMIDKYYPTIQKKKIFRILKNKWSKRQKNIEVLQNLKIFKLKYILFLTRLKMKQQESI